MTAITFQTRVQPWLLACFGAEIAADRSERNHRFLEESLELVQACGCSASEAHQLVDYVFGRPVGEPAQEAGGVMVTLAALCLANSLDMHEAGETELARIWTKVEAIRAKQAAKPKHSPLPAAPAAVAGPAPATFMAEDRACEWAWDKVREEVGTKGWTAGDCFTFHGFYLWGWNYRGQYELQRAAALAALKQELTAAPALEAPAAPVGSARQFIEWMYSQPEDREPTTAEGALLEFEAHLAAAAPQAPAAPAEPHGLVKACEAVIAEWSRQKGLFPVLSRDGWMDECVAELRLAIQAEPAAPSGVVGDMAALVKQLVQALRKAAPNHVLPAKALDYLRRQGLQGSPLRAAPAAPAVDAETVKKAARYDWLRGSNVANGTVLAEHFGGSRMQDFDAVIDAKIAARAAQTKEGGA